MHQSAKTASNHRAAAPSSPSDSTVRHIPYLHFRDLAPSADAVFDNLPQLARSGHCAEHAIDMHQIALARLDESSCPPYSPHGRFFYTCELVDDIAVAVIAQGIQCKLAFLARYDPDLVTYDVFLQAKHQAEIALRARSGDWGETQTLKTWVIGGPDSPAQALHRIADGMCARSNSMVRIPGKRHPESPRIGVVLDFHQEMLYTFRHHAFLPDPYSTALETRSLEHAVIDLPDVDTCIRYPVVKLRNPYYVGIDRT